MADSEYNLGQLADNIKRKAKKKLRRKSSGWNLGSSIQNLVWLVSVAATAFLGWKYMKERDQLVAAHAQVGQHLSRLAGPGHTTLPSGPPPQQPLKSAMNK